MVILEEIRGDGTFSWEKIDLAKTLKNELL